MYNRVPEQNNIINFQDEIINRINTIPLNDFLLKIDEIKSVTSLLDKRINSENDREVLRELQELNKDISQAISYIRGQYRLLSNAKFNDTNPNVRAANKIFEELKANLVKAYTLAMEPKPELLQNVIGEHLPMDPIGNPSPLLPTQPEPISQERVDTTDTLLAEIESMIEAKFLELQSRLNRGSESNSKPETLEIDDRYKALEDQIKALRAELDLYTNRPMYNDLLEVDAIQRRSDELQEFEAEISEMLKQYNMDKLPKNLEDELIILRQFGSEEMREAFLKRLEDYFGNKSTNSSFSDSTRPADLDETRKIEATVPMSQNTRPIQSIENPTRAAKKGLMDIFYKNTKNINVPSLDPETSQKYNELQAAVESDMSVADFKKILYPLMYELDRIEKLSSQVETQAMNTAQTPPINTND